ncbi:MAG: hypothetical protein HY433_03725 [Candidatus Liptonbacteria bacterium]|nr:hypothetical protein [Candidatus Liptonbacteria bacterium]
MNFLKRLQESEENVKRRWLILGSAVMMILVVFIWLNYFNTLVQQASAPAQTEQAERGLTFWQTFKSGLGIVFQTAGSKIKYWFEIARSPKSYSINP